jgi:hypothetical protein
MQPFSRLAGREATMVEDTDQGDHLNSEAKAAIRSYMLKVATPSAIALSVVSAVIGFLINEWARGEAYVKAYGEASQNVMQMATSAGQARGQAELFLAETKTMNEAISKIGEQIKRQKIEVDEFLNKNYQEIAAALLRDDEFRKTLAGLDAKELQALISSLSRLKVDLTKWSANPAVNGQESRISDCPPGAYAVGFAFQDEAGLAHGALWTGHIVCRFLNVSGSDSK